MQAIIGSPSTPAPTKDGTAGISTNLGSYFPFVQAAAPDAGNAPKAYLNVLFFNKRMKFVKEGSTAARVEHAGNNTLPLLLQHIRAPKNGYCYVYLSNESDEAVYFDNFQRLPDKVMYPLWKLGSRSLAGGATGEANVIIKFQNARLNSIWFTIEQPILESRGILIKYIPNIPK